MAEVPTETVAEESPKAPLATDTAPKPDPAAGLHSRYQKQVAEATKRAQAAEQAAESARTEAAEARNYIKVLEERGEVSEDEAERMRRLAAREAAADKREREVVSHEKSVVASLLSAQYGIPVEEIQGLEGVKDMEIAALKWQRDNPTKAEAPPESEAPKPKEDPEPPEPRSAFDGGDGASPRESIADMSDEEFAKLDKRWAAEAQKRARAMR